MPSYHSTQSFFHRTVPDDDVTLCRSRGDGSGRVASSTPQTSRSDEFNNNASGGGEQGTGGKTYSSSGINNDDNIDRRAPSVDRPLNLEMHGRRSAGSTVAAERPISGSSGNGDDRESGKDHVTCLRVCISLTSGWLKVMCETERVEVNAYAYSVDTTQAAFDHTRVSQLFASSARFTL